MDSMDDGQVAAMIAGARGTRSETYGNIRITYGCSGDDDHRWYFVLIDDGQLPAPLFYVDRVRGPDAHHLYAVGRIGA